MQYRQAQACRHGHAGTCMQAKACGHRHAGTGRRTYTAVSPPSWNLLQLALPRASQALQVVEVRLMQAVKQVGAAQVTLTTYMGE